MLCPPVAALLIVVFYPAGIEYQRTHFPLKHPAAKPHCSLNILSVSVQFPPTGTEFVQVLLLPQYYPTLQSIEREQVSPNFLLAPHLLLLQGAPLLQVKFLPSQ